MTLAPTSKGRLVDQLKISGGGILAGAFVVPVVIADWTPAGFALGWFLLYVVQSFFFLGAVSWTGNGAVWCVWESFTAAMFGAICLSVLAWGADHPSAAWIALTVTLAFISFELATVPYLPVPNWFISTFVASVPLVAMVAVAIGVLVGIGIMALLAAMVFVAVENRRLRRDLDHRLGAAKAKLRTDDLTGLLNRRGLEAELEELEGHEVTVAIFDANRFKHINDTQGHAVGDRALIAIADHLRSTLDDGWALSRYGGDEFVAVTRGSVRLDKAAALSIVIPMGGRDGSLTVSISAGIACGRVDVNGDHLLSEAGFALRQAKREGLKVVRSEGQLRDRFERSLAISGIDAEDSPLVPVVQPIVTEEGVVGCETLARWRLDDGTLLAPGMFMDMLVENGLLGRLDDLMLEHAVELIARLDTLGHDVYVSANISASHLLDPEVASRVGDLLASHDVDPGRLMIEVTESEQLGEDRLWERSVLELRKLGIKLAIDDFGAGYSSVARLARLPFTHLKLDRTLVQEAGGPLGAIIHGVSRFCDASDIGVIAEGIETTEDLREMRDAGVTIFQGYFFGRPVRVDDFLRDLEQRRERSAPADDPIPAPDWLTEAPAT